MGNVTGKRRRARQTEVTESPHEAPRQAKTAQETHQDDAPEFGGHVFLANFDKTVGEDEVDFQTDLSDIDGQYIFQNLTKNGLAYSAGFRTGDRLFQVNGTNIEGYGIEYILNLLHTFHGYQVPQLMLAVERKPETGGGPSVFIWVIFKVVWQDGVPKVEVIQRQENDSEETPFFDFDPGYTAFSWVNRPVDPYDIYIDNKPQLYLAIDNNNKVVFQEKYDRCKSRFYRYVYTGGEPENGEVFAFSLQPLQPSEDKAQGNTPSGTAEKTVKALDFPKWMTGSNIEPNARFWYVKRHGATFSFESVMAKGMYLGKAEKCEAILSKKKTEMKMNSRMYLGKAEKCEAILSKKKTEMKMNSSNFATCT